MQFNDLLKFEEDLRLEKKTVVILRWIALLGQLVTIYLVHFWVGFNLPLIFCSLTIFFGGVTNIFIQFSFKKNQLSNIESTILLFYDVIQLAVLIYLTGGVTNPFVIFLVVPAIVSSTLFFEEISLLKAFRFLTNKLIANIIFFLLLKNTSLHIISLLAAIREKSRSPPALNFIRFDFLFFSKSNAVFTIL